MSNKQTYEVETVYKTVDKTSHNADEMSKALKKTADNAQSLQNVLKGLGAAFVGSRVIGEAKKHFIDYNKEVENHKTVLAGLMTMYTGTSLEKTWDRAGTSVARFEQMAKSSSLTTKDLVETAGGLTKSLLQSGMSMKEIEDISFGVANAAKAFGQNGAVVSMDVEQALTSTVGMRDRFMRSILAQKEIGLTAEQFNAKKLSEKVDIIKKGLTTSAIKDMAKKQGEDTFGGVLSTLEDNFQILASKIGLPLFKAITQEVKNWNQWIDKNQRKLQEIGKVVSDTMISGFKTMKDVFAWIYNHGDMLISIAKAYAAIKITSSITQGAIGSIAGSAGGLLGFLRSGDKEQQRNPDGTFKPLDKGGLGRQKVGLGNLGEMAPFIGAALGAGVALGNLINKGDALSNSIAGVIKVNGEILDATDKTTKQYALLTRTMKTLEKAAQEAGDRLAGIKGAGGSQIAANMAARTDIANQKQQLIKELMSGLATDSDIMSKSRAKYKLENSGLFDDDELKKIASNPQEMINKLSQESAWWNQRQSAAVGTANAAWESIPNELRKSLDQQKITAALMSKTLQMMPSQMGKYSSPIILSKEIIDQVLKETGADDDIRGQQKVNQQVNITIQQVMAKDPNRWIAEMDDHIARRTRNPTRAKNGWKTTVK